MKSVTTILKQRSGLLPDEKAERYGVESLSDAELLAVLLRTGAQGQNVLALSEQLLHAHGGTLAGVLARAQGREKELAGIGRVKRLQLAAVGEMSRRIWRSEREHGVAMTDSAAVYDYFREDLRHAQTEEVHLALLDVRCHLLRHAILSVGTLRASLVSPREVFVHAIRNQAAAFILLHNHPSGDCTPSREDIEITQTLRKLGETMQIPMLDHIIVGDPGYYSFKDHGGFR